MVNDGKLVGKYTMHTWSTFAFSSNKRPDVWNHPCLQHPQKTGKSPNVKFGTHRVFDVENKRNGAPRNGESPRRSLPWATS